MIKYKNLFSTQLFNLMVLVQHTYGTCVKMMKKEGKKKRTNRYNSFKNYYLVY